MQSQKGRQTKQRFLMSLLKFTSYLMLYLCDFFFLQELWLLHNSSRGQCHTPNASCSLQQKKYTGLPMLLTQSLTSFFIQWAVSESLSTAASIHREILQNTFAPFVLTTDCKSSCPSCLDAKCAGTARPSQVQMLLCDLPSRYCARPNLMLIAYRCEVFLGHSWKRALLPYLFPCPQSLR